MIRHIVSWKLSAEDEAGKDAAAATITETLEGLVPLIPEILALRVGRNVAYPQTNFDLVLVADYASLEALDAYQVHPEHQRAVGIIKPLVALRANVDFEV
jgi:hypothetical protein